MDLKQQLVEFFATQAPHVDFEIDALDSNSISIRKIIKPEHTRPGGTVSGPVQMELADLALYVAILSEIGLVALAVTTSLNFNFLRKPSADKDLIATCRLLKVGAKLIVGEVFLYSQGDDRPVSHAIGTYARPSS